MGGKCAEERDVSRILTGLTKSHREKKVAVTPPKSCAITKGGTSAGRIPQRARVTAGFAKEVGSSHEICYGSGAQTEFHCWPIFSISRLSASRSRLASGRLRNRLMRRWSMKKASRKARSTCSVVPCTAAGSGMPQCAVMGWPDKMGQTSFAALSQTVKTKFNGGASGRENSSQGLLRRPLVGICAIVNCRRASGRMAPEGWLPALYAVKVGLPLKFRIASAMMERAEFPVHRNRTL